jgi:hypothetical protein
VGASDVLPAAAARHVEQLDADPPRSDQALG